MTTQTALKPFTILTRSLYSENTAEYGYGDSPKTRWSSFTVYAETPRKAMNRAKKVRPGLRFGGQFGAIVEAG